MVGIKTWTDEQIALILDRKASGAAVQEIVNEINQRWSRKNAKDSGVRYVLTNYKDGIPPQTTAGGSKGRRDQKKAQPKPKAKRETPSPAQPTSRLSLSPETDLAAYMRGVSAGPIPASLFEPRPFNVLQGSVQSTNGLLAHAKQAQEIGIYNIERGATVSPPADPPTASPEPERRSTSPNTDQISTGFDHSTMQHAMSMPIYGTHTGEFGSQDMQQTMSFPTHGLHDQFGSLVPHGMPVPWQQHNYMTGMREAPGPQKFGGCNAHNNFQQEAFHQQQVGDFGWQEMSTNDQQLHTMGPMQAQSRPSSVNHHRTRVQGNGQYIGANMGGPLGGNIGTFTIDPQGRKIPRVLQDLLQLQQSYQQGSRAIVSQVRAPGRAMTENTTSNALHRPDQAASKSYIGQSFPRPPSTQNANPQLIIDPQLSNSDPGGVPSHILRLKSMVDPSFHPILFEGNLYVNGKQIDQEKAGRVMGTIERNNLPISLQMISEYLFINGHPVSEGAALATGKIQGRPTQTDLPRPPIQQSLSVSSTSQSNNPKPSPRQTLREPNAAHSLENPTKEAQVVASSQPIVSDNSILQKAQNPNNVTFQTNPPASLSTQQNQNIRKIVWDNPIFDQPFVFPTTNDGWYRVLQKDRSGQPQPANLQSLIFRNGPYEVHFKNPRFLGGCVWPQIQEFDGNQYSRHQMMDPDTTEQHSNIESDLHYPSVMHNEDAKPFFTKQVPMSGSAQGNRPRTPTMQAPASSRHSATPSKSTRRLEEANQAATGNLASETGPERTSERLPNPLPKLLDSHGKESHNKPTMKRPAPTTEDERGSPSKRRKSLEQTAPGTAFVRAVEERHSLSASQLSIPEGKVKLRPEQAKSRIASHPFKPRPSKPLHNFQDLRPQSPQQYSTRMANSAAVAIQNAKERIQNANERIRLASKNASSTSAPALPSPETDQAQRSLPAPQPQRIPEDFGAEAAHINQHLRENQASSLEDASAMSMDQNENVGYYLGLNDSRTNDTLFGDTEILNNDDLDRLFDDMEGQTNIKELEISSSPPNQNPTQATCSNEAVANISPPNLISDSNTSKYNSESPSNPDVPGDDLDEELGRIFDESMGSVDEQVEAPGPWGADGSMDEATKNYWGSGGEFADILNYGGKNKPAAEEDLMSGFGKNVW